MYSPRTLAAMAGSGDAESRRIAARSPNTPPQFLNRLASDPKLAPLVAANPTAHPQTLRQLAAYSPLLAQAVAGNTNCPVEILKELAHSPHAKVRSQVAANRRCPTDTLEVLAVDTDEEVRSWVCQHPARSSNAEMMARFRGVDPELAYFEPIIPEKRRRRSSPATDRSPKATLSAVPDTEGDG